MATATTIAKVIGSLSIFPGVFMILSVRIYLRPSYVNIIPEFTYTFGVRIFYLFFVLKLQGAGIVPIDDSMSRIAAIYVSSSSLRLFFVVLGSCKVLGSFALFNIGPMNSKCARLGLILSAGCGAYGHYAIGESTIPPLLYSACIGSLYILDNNNNNNNNSKGNKIE
tara:strand:- start:4 stop:504 length:501 start_codon:yes stop_codon:yes gene_type:complete